MPMEIIQAKSTDLIEILFLLKVCIRDMNSKGFKHWNNTYPDIATIRMHLEKGMIYLAKDKGVCKGMVTLNEHQPDEYKSVNFPSGLQKPLYLQNMVVHPKWQGKGFATMMIEFSQKFARDKGFDCIRLDVFMPSENARQLYEKQLFREVATFHSEFQKIPYICYEKQI
jgi:ribosomal protein S18 acetylase RimI-like enzyme